MTKNCAICGKMDERSILQRNVGKRESLKAIEQTVVTALANQPENEEECERILNRALASIELRAHTARTIQQLDKDSVEPPAGGVLKLKPRNGEVRPDCSRLY